MLAGHRYASKQLRSLFSLKTQDVTFGLTFLRALIRTGNEETDKEVDGARGLTSAQ
jgi:hypothetical protein